MLYVIAGDGTGPVKEITAALKDLRDKATKEKVDFWIVVEGKDEPTATDEAIYAWMRKNEVWFEVYTASGTTIDGAQDTLPAEDVFTAMLERIQERQADSEDAAVLILQVDPEGATDADDALMEFVGAAVDADVEVFALNGQMDKIELTEEVVEPEPEPEPAAPVKGASKKAAAGATKAPAKKASTPTKAAGASKRAAAPAAEEQDGAPNDPDEAVGEGMAYTSEDLTKMNPAELGAVARGQGIDPKGMGKKELIAAILSVQSGESTMVSSVAQLTNGDDDVVIIIVPRSKLAALLS
jgi:hypothetical protein